MKCAKCGNEMAVYLRHISEERARAAGNAFSERGEYRQARAGTYRLHVCYCCNHRVVEPPSPNEVISRS
jgi:hypothetical protein